MNNVEIISVKDLTKKFPIGMGEFTALNGINLSFTKGEFAGVVGPSGSGKTTLLNIIGLLDNPSSGDATILGNSSARLTVREAALLRRKHMGFIFQTYNLLPVYTVYENTEFPLLLLRMSNAERKKAVLSALEWVGLTDKIDSRPAQLSGGECQRVAIARAISHRPSLIMADEPTGELDTTTGTTILNLLKQIVEGEKVGVIVVTHDISATKFATVTHRMSDGSMVE